MFEVDGQLRAAMDEVYARCSLVVRRDPAQCTLLTKQWVCRYERMAKKSTATVHDFSLLRQTEGMDLKRMTVPKGVGAKIAAAVGLTEGGRAFRRAI